MPYKKECFIDKRMENFINHAYWAQKEHDHSWCVSSYKYTFLLWELVVKEQLMEKKWIYL